MQERPPEKRVGPFPLAPPNPTEAPHVTQTNFATLLIGYLVLLAGNLFKGM